MSDIAIRVESLSKRYRLGQRQGQETLRERLVRLTASSFRTLTRPFRRASCHSGNDDRAAEELFWALQDVSFEVQRGDVVGIIGRNGAGKSTLLKILSRITEPTAGRAMMEGRVASLLEVGTGFHPELTGRENVYLNGAILGMRRAEIRNKFGEIVAFAEVEKFIDTPVKHYSSGMYLRLAFAVAAHLDPEILIVDEVLAVGDVGFQNKCLGKMREAAQGGRTALLVSHNLASIVALCPQCIWLDRGKVREFGTSSQVIASYVSESASVEERAEVLMREKPNQAFQLTRVRLENQHCKLTNGFNCDEPIRVVLTVKVRRVVPGLYAYLEIIRADGLNVLVSDSFDSKPNPLDDLPVGVHTVTVTIPARSLGSANYMVYLNFTSRLSDCFDVDSPGHVCRFQLEDSTSYRGNNRGGFFSTLLDWRVLPGEAGSARSS